MKNPKRRRVTEEEESQRIERAERAETAASTDIISSLPDCLLSHILSFLPIRDSAATSVLSRRWRHLWILVPILDLDFGLEGMLMNNYFWEKERTFSFMDTVSMILSLRNAIPDPKPLHKLRLHCSSSDSDPSYFETCLQDPITIVQLQELDLDLYFPNQPLELPRSVFFCTTLVVLKLDDDFLLNPPPASTCMFPSLKILQLQHISYADGDSLSTLLAACPVLEDLTLIVNYFLLKHAGKFNIIVPVPTLKSFFISCICVESSSYKLHINTPALEYLRFIGPLGDDVVLEDLPNLVKSVVNIENHKTMSITNYAKRVGDFMGLLYNVVSIELHMVTLQILYNVSNDDVPKFHNLSTLTFYGRLQPDWNVWHAIRLLLCRAPKLQTLAFRLIYHADNGSIESIPDSCLEESMDVPECLSSHLTTCHYKVLSGFGVEMKLVKLILKAAKVLKTMRITVRSLLESKAKLQVQEELRKFPKSSQTCQIAFDYENK
ncbi:F-box/LRR-repeat protein At4g14103 [Quercus suber]|uniref:F-box/LRR-repeat protein At4g14103 n=1 Tax=Quercus suber TaxID=58331 RepID=UPI000CE186B4|nr:F-box/LRR-repeat protein At4g14103-like [Quercus suber]POE91433.1 f-box/lrr-repeat protein [Quercus suber]